jgi:L-ascorbate metabolism protein UlaG (beta-lactamase superfamily)
MLRFIVSTVVVLISWGFLSPMTANASRCIAYADRTPDVTPVKFSTAQTSGEVHITYVGHSTFRLKTSAGVIIATDYAGYAGAGPTPTVATMNQAHETHYTEFPDPEIKHVLKGWNPDGGPAKHSLTVKDVYIRNVSTDIRGWIDTIVPDGNSIFIFEVAGLCIGHLGHLHHKPTPGQLARIGRLDVVFAPVDGGHTLDLASMIEVLKGLRASLVIPMHYFGGESLAYFVEGMSSAFVIETKRAATTVVSLPSLPKRPTVLVLLGN